MAERVPDLSDGQRECLRLVLLHMSSKDIARALGISPHTVDQRIKRAMRALDTDNRWEAARMLAASEGASEYQRLVYQPPDLVTDDADGAHQRHDDHRDRHSAADTSNVFHDATHIYQWPAGHVSSRISLPIPSHEGGCNDLTVWQRLGWIALIAIGSAIGFGALLSGLDALGKLT